MKLSDNFSSKILFDFFQKSLSKIPSHVLKKSPSRCTEKFFTLLNGNFTKGERRIVSFRRENFFVDSTVAFERNSRRGWTALYRLIAFPCAETLEGCVKGWWKESKDKELNHSAPAKKSRCWKVNEGGIK